MLNRNAHTRTRKIIGINKTLGIHYLLAFMSSIVRLVQDRRKMLTDTIECGGAEAQKVLEARPPVVCGRLAALQHAPCIPAPRAPTLLTGLNRASERPSRLQGKDGRGGVMRGTRTIFHSRKHYSRRPHLIATLLASLPCRTVLHVLLLTAGRTD